MRPEQSIGQSTQMGREIAQIPHCIARQLQDELPSYIETGRRLREFAPEVIVSVARGSSDCAAAFLKHLVETRLGVPVASVGPSLSSVYHRSLRLGRAVSWSISQSGASDDINALQASNRSAGALSVALVNSPDSRLAQNADIALSMGAGPELALPATKSFVCSLVAITAVVAEWAKDAKLLRSLHDLPDLIVRAAKCDWSLAAEALAQHDTALVLGRGLGFPIACEAALKLKETGYIFAESFSAAEVWHGPAALFVPDRPVLVFAQSDETLPGVLASADKIRLSGARVFVASSERTVDWLPTISAFSSVSEVLAMISRFYSLAEHVSLSRGVDVDSPRGLKKVTVTV